MKAVLANQYGSPSDLKVEDIPVPEPQKGEVLVRVKATTVNDFDLGLVTGKPGMYRLLFGLLRPRHPVPGIELAGTVEKLGFGVTTLLPGDEVYGDISDSGWGTWAEYACVKAEDLVKKPENISFEAAAATPHAALLAWQGLMQGKKIEHDMDVLVNGAGGGMGMFAAQFLQGSGATLIGVDRAEKFDMMTSVGYQHLIDYRTEDFTTSGKQVDLILDAKSTRNPREYLRALKPSGHYVTVGGKLGKLARIQIRKMLYGQRSDKQLSVLSLKPNQGLNQINQMVEQGKLRPVIDGPYALEDIPRLVTYFGNGEHLGKIVVSL